MIRDAQLTSLQLLADHNSLQDVKNIKRSHFAIWPLFRLFEKKLIMQLEVHLSFLASHICFWCAEATKQESCSHLLVEHLSSSVLLGSFSRCKAGKPFSHQSYFLQISGQIYITVSSIQRHLTMHAMACTNENKKERFLWILIFCIKILTLTWQNDLFQKGYI